MFIVSRGTKKPVVSSPKKEEEKPVVVPPVVEEPKVEEQPIELKTEYNVVKPRKRKISNEELVKEILTED
jgi:hypothetical protein